MEYSPKSCKKDGRVLMIAAAIIAGLRLARDPRAGHKSERVVYAVEDAVFLANDLRFGVVEIRQGKSGVLVGVKTA